ncbi:MAG: hypothetical protein GY832_35490 [Chloroflexi bacterium]|nr:hypothetical protein [Chloroflexota bacterium]
MIPVKRKKSVTTAGTVMTPQPVPEGTKLQLHCTLFLTPRQDLLLARQAR